MKKRKLSKLLYQLAKIKKYLKKHPELEPIIDKWCIDNKINENNPDDIKDFVQYFNKELKK